MTMVARIMGTRVRFQKQNIPLEADYNVARPAVEVKHLDVVLSYDSTEEPIMGKIMFVDVVAFRVGAPNDHGFYEAGRPGIVNDSIYSWERFPEIEFGNFYEVFGIDWTSGLIGEGTKVLQSNVFPTNIYRHFVFFMRDGTFEVVCKRWEALYENEG
jgi:hypothetical protein